jgi:hypothetical protein
MKHEWIVRASSMGAIMSCGKGANTLGAKFYAEVQKMVLYNKFGIDKRIWTKYMEKGNLMEAEGVHLASRVLGWFDIPVIDKKPRFSNDWVIGEPDVLTPTLLADIKSSWDGTTFPWFESKLPNKDYDWQMQTYMYLCDREECELVYTLTDTPEHLIRAEIRKITFGVFDKAEVDPYYQNKSMSEIEAKIERDVRSQMSFGHIPEELRVKRFMIYRDEAKIEAMKDRITLAREIYDEYYKELLQN